MLITKEDKQKIIKFMKDYERITKKFDINAESIKIAEVWLNDSKEEFSAFKILKKQQDLHLKSLNHLILCVEKLVKCYGILHNVINEKSAKHEIGHISPKVFLKILQKTEMHSFLKLYIKNYDLLNPEENILKLKEIFGKRIDSRNVEELARMSEKDMKNIFNIVHKISTKIEEEMKNKTFEDITQSKNVNANVINYIKNELVKEEVWDKIKNIKIEKLYIGPVLNMNLFSLAIITFPHNISSRYVNAFVGKIEYNDNLGIIANLDLIEEKVSYCVRLVEESFELIKQGQKVI